MSNAVRHARVDAKGTLGLGIEIGSRIVRVVVVDGGPGFDSTTIVRSPRAEEGGWGLFLVEELSDRWGIAKSPHRVWFEIDLES